MVLEDVLNPARLAEIRRVLDASEFVDGRVTGGKRGETKKDNMQVKPSEAVTRQVLPAIQQALYDHPVFRKYALPKRIHLNINRYEKGMRYDDHTDAGLVGMFPHNAARSDLSMTLFLNDPGEYEGGELVVQMPTGEERVKLPGGDAILYSGGMVHRVEPIQSGARLAAFAWVESMIRDPQRRQIAYDAHLLRTDMAEKGAAEAHITAVDNLYNNLIRLWAEF